MSDPTGQTDHDGRLEMDAGGPVAVGSRCRLCDTLLPDTALLTLERAPAAAQGFLQPHEVDADTPIRLTVRECVGCGLVQAECPPVPGWRHVIRSGGNSPEMRTLRERQFRHFLAATPRTDGTVLEVGSGSGDLLEILLQCGARAVGLEASAAGVRTAEAKGLPIHQGYPTAGLPLPGAPFDAFVSVNVLEHALDPRDFLIGVKENVGPQAIGMVEVPSFERIIEQRRFYDFIADHVSYFTSETLRLALELTGFEVLEMSRDWWADDIVAFVRARPGHRFETAQADLDAASAAVAGFIEGFSRSGRPVAIWGASHQALTLLALADVRDAAYVIDSAPFKQGLLTPATHLRVVSPAEAQRDPPEGILVMAAGYSDEVVRTILNEMDFKGVVGVLRGNDVELVPPPDGS